jgi:riboflavin transporter
MTRTERTAKLAKMAMLCAISVVLMLLIRIPFPPAPFLVYDPADIPIIISGFAFGPLAAFAMTAVVSFIQAFILGGDGLIGFFMHLVATGSFVLVAGLIYRKHKSKKMAIVGLFCGGIVMTLTMMGWNLLITPMFLGVSRDAVLGMLLPIIMPFNLIKAAINSVITFFVYKPLSRFLHK